MSKTEENPFEAFNLLTDDAIVRETDVEIQEVDSLVETPEAEVKEEETEKKEKATETKSTLKDLEIQQVEKMEDAVEDEVEEEVEAETKEEEVVAEEEVEEEEDQESSIKVFADYLHDKGILDFEKEEFEDSEDGLMDVITNTIKKRVEEYKETLPPVAKEFLDFIDAGGDPSNFIETYSDVDYSRIPEENLEDRADAQKQIVADLLYREGYTGEEIQEELADYEESGILHNKAKRALKKLQVHQAREKQELVKKQKEKEALQREQHAEFLDKLNKDITSRTEIAGFSVTDKQKKDFYSYLTKVNRKSGKTQLMMDAANDPDAQLKMAWLYFNKFDFSKLEKKVKTEAVSDLKSRLQRATTTSSKKMASKKRSKAPEEAASDFSMFRRLIK